MKSSGSKDVCESLHGHRSSAGVPGESGGPAPRYFCKRCGYSLYGLERSRCPECGVEFSLSDPRSYRTRRPLPAWARALSKWSLTAGVTALVIAAVVYAVSSYHRIVEYDIGLRYASLRESSHYMVLGRTLARRTAAVRDTQLTTFLRREDPGGKERWTRCGTIAYDWRGRQVDYYFPHGGRAFFGDIPFKAQNLGAVHKLVPNLPQMIRDDILGAKQLGVSVMLAGVLEKMCRDPSDDNIKRLLREWEWIKQHPGLFGDA